MIESPLIQDLLQELLAEEETRAAGDDSERSFQRRTSRHRQRAQDDR
jgi:hypothetical protein